MKVILTRDVPNVGKDGEVVTVADGYARNYLFPRHLAVVAKGAAMKQHEARITRENVRSEQLLTSARESAERLREKQFQITAKAAPKSTRLFGSVTEADVAAAIQNETGVIVDKRRISLIDPIKVTGVFELTARLHPEVIVPFSVEVVTAEILEARAKAQQLIDDKAAKEAERTAAAEAAASAAEAAQKSAETEEAAAPAAEDAVPAEA